MGGNLLSYTGGGAALANPFRYRSYYYDIESGFYYLNSRFYDPVIGRFINADGLVSTGQGVNSCNMFAYCGNNPVNLNDSSGCYPTAIEMANMLVGINENTKGYSIKDLVMQLHKESETTVLSEHHKKGTTNPKNRSKHEKGQARKERDQHGEKGDMRRKPNPNKRHRSVPENFSTYEKITGGVLAVGATVGVIYFIANDATVVGASDDACILPLLKVIWDNVEIVFG